MFGRFKSQSLPSIDASALAQRLTEKDDLVILDVRERWEVEAGHIPGAKLIPMGQVASRSHELPKDVEIVCVCRSGARSASIAQTLLSQGFKAINLRGGMLGWRGPVERN